MLRLKGFKVLVLCFVLAQVPLNVFAVSQASSNVKLEGKAEGIVFIKDNELFLHGPGMIPGDEVSGQIVIENNYEFPYTLTVRAERVSPTEQYDLLRKLELTIYYKDEVIYEGPVSGENGMSEPIDLGTYQPGDKVTLYAEVVLDGPTTGNEYKNKYAEVDWIFNAIRSTDEKPHDPLDPVNPDKPSTGIQARWMYAGIGVITVALGLIIINRKKRGETK